MESGIVNIEMEIARLIIPTNDGNHNLMELITGYIFLNAMPIQPKLNLKTQTKFTNKYFISDLVANHVISSSERVTSATIVTYHFRSICFPFLSFVLNDDSRVLSSG